MDPVTSLITIIASIFIALFGIVAIAGSMYGILFWHPAQRKKKYEVDKVFTIPSSVVMELRAGKMVAVWVNPKEPRNLGKIAIHIE